MPRIIFITPDGTRHDTDVESGYFRVPKILDESCPTSPISRSRKRRRVFVPANSPRSTSSTSARREKPRIRTSLKADPPPGVCALGA